mmetsp:Transcript_26735/g.39431  ORF Transcript_26735/g.39431 Transcript_26735/m.39431 type:complete len:116 (+) Transcript_26735:510-857(+)
MDPEKSLVDATHQDGSAHLKNKNKLFFSFGYHLPELRYISADSSLQAEDELSEEEKVQDDEADDMIMIQNLKHTLAKLAKVNGRLRKQREELTDEVDKEKLKNKKLRESEPRTIF